MFLFSCNYNTCDNDQTIQIPISEHLKLLGHKGSGPINKNGNINLLENTWDAIKNAMDKLDGSEIDIQMSADSTLWIFHDHGLLNCEDSLINFFLCSDEKLLQISKCNYNDELIQLSTFLSKANAQNWENKTLSLDLKVLYNPEVNRTFKKHDELLSYLDNKLKTLLDNSQLDIYFEVFNINEYAHLNQVFPGKVCLVNYSPSLAFIQEMNVKQKALSLPINELTDSFKSKGIQIQNLWTINTADQFIKSLSYHPQFLESDNIPLMLFFKSLQEGNKLKCTSSIRYPVRLKKEEFYALDSINFPLSHNILFQFETVNDTFPEGVFLTFTSFSEDRESKKWEGIKLNETPKGYYFLNPKYLEYLGASKVKISIWNKDKKNFDCTLKLMQLVID